MCVCVGLIFIVSTIIIVLFISHVFNPRRACAARVTVVVLCVRVSLSRSVCLSTTILGLQATRRYQCLQCYKGTKNKMAILLKRLRSRDMA